MTDKRSKHKWWLEEAPTEWDKGVSHEYTDWWINKDKPIEWLNEYLCRKCANHITLRTPGLEVVTARCTSCKYLMQRKYKMGTLMRWSQPKDQ